MAADPVEENSSQDLAWHREEVNPPVVVTLLGVTFSLPDRNDNAPSPVGRDVTGLSHEEVICRLKIAS